MIRYLVFDIETRVDKELVKQIYDPEDSLTLEQAYDAARDQILKRSNQQSDFFPVPFHIPISIATLQADENYRIVSLGCLGADRFSESELIARFWQIFENARTLVTFNGRGFDLPVLEIQALKHGLSVQRYFGQDQGRNTYRSNRYSDAFHIDLCDFLSNFGAVYPRNSLNLLAKLIGLPGKYTIEGEDVEYLYRQGRHKEINQYCMTDVLQTYLLFLRVELLRGKLTKDEYQSAVDAAGKDLMERANSAGTENFLMEFLQRWDPEIRNDS
ncbi:MAG: ribonuclease H-like domain-containing protein [Acidobacteria bacterium]|nr:ribonuclease H-like domain-containing protein [Acidobacteriota bacterium]